VVWALAIEDFVQCPYVVTTRSTMGSSPWRFHGMYFFSWPLVPALVLLLAAFLRGGQRCRLWLTDEVPSTLVGSDIDVCFPKELLQGRWSFLEDSSDEDAESLDPQ
jgi:hypothetical protein